MKQMRNECQVRFMLTGKVGFISVSIGFALEWQCGILTHIVIAKNVSESDFMKDDTVARALPPPVTSEATDPTSTDRKVSAYEKDSDDDTDVDEDTSESINNGSGNVTPTTTTMPVSDSASSERQKEKQEKNWYFGKYVGRKLPSQNNDTQSPNTAQKRPTLVPTDIGGEVLEPPYLCPKPPNMPAVVSVTVLSCTNLKSRLNRLVERPVNAYVSVEVDHKIRHTAIVKRNHNPTFDENDTFIFPLTREFSRMGGYIYFTVMDKNLLDENVLAKVAIPLASLKVQTDDSEAPVLNIPLHHRERLLGKGFRGSIHSPHTTSILTVRIARVDIHQWWVYEELKLRDEAREKAKQDEIRRLKAEEDERIRKEAERLHKGMTEKSEQWQDSQLIHSCSRCHTEFTMTHRKHHCRLCGNVVCAVCSDHRIAISSGDIVRACDVCFEARQKQDEILDPPGESNMSAAETAHHDPDDACIVS
eukprot:CAMPEP_0185033086 /NCGR_PEP_ID=MMETSP1103-20130426/21725_1 /TAXON_ID=36769 /ORGANISM="Paraphysomonas bandaiensis, Strain Caron Lab Isolate" /LENGTH=474 /DNA_ID=CAMNT_0027569223 /DNA_START=245 /DNA_END=1669 /DNA_ORIENTATION=+